jgi:hypothetical protein
MKAQWDRENTRCVSMFLQSMMDLNVIPINDVVVTSLRILDCEYDCTLLCCQKNLEK